MVWFKKMNNICCLCNIPFNGYGNNPAPLKDKGICCDKCNILVIIERLKRLATKNKSN